MFFNLFKRVIIIATKIDKLEETFQNEKYPKMKLKQKLFEIKKSKKFFIFIKHYKI